MPATRASAKLAAREDAGPYKPRANLRSAKASKYASDTTEKIDIRLNNEPSSRAATTVLPRMKGTRERCTKQQTADLEELYRVTEGYPTIEQMEQIAVDIGKSYDSTRVWMRNRRQKGKNSATNPGADTAGPHDTTMLDVTASGHPEEPVEGLASSLPPTKAKKQKGRAVKPHTERGGTSRSTHAKKQPAATPSSMPIGSSPAIDNSLTNEATPMDHDHPSGDSDGSASPSTVIQPIVREPWVPTKPARPFDEYSPHEIDAAAGVALMKPRAENPAYEPRVITCDHDTEQSSSIITKVAR